MTNQQIAHRFFYQKHEGESYYPRNFNCGYRGNVFFSYATPIAKIVENKQGKTVLLVSRDNMSNTTAKHIHNVLIANPQFKIYWVAFKFGDSLHDNVNIASNFVNNLAYCARQKMTQKAYRENFISCFEDAQKFTNDIYENANLIAELKKHTDLYKTVTDEYALKEYRATIALAKREQRAKEKAEFLVLTKGKSVCELAELAYSRLSWKDSQKLVKQLNPRGELAFVWFDDENKQYKSSKSIHLDETLGDVTLKLWKNGKLKHGMKLAQYTVLKVCNDYVTIGCHKIPTANLVDLCRIRGI